MLLRNTRQRTALRLFNLICACLLVSACQFFDGNGDDSKLTGQAVKGVISNAIIKVYSNQGKELIAQSRSNAAGKYSLDLSTATENSLLLVELSVDDETRMRCDLTEGCIEQISGQLKAFGDKVRLPSYFTLLGATSKVADGPQTPAHLSPLSHIIVTTAQSLPQGLSKQNIATVSQWLIESFDLNTNPLVSNSADLTSLGDSAGFTNAALQQAILGAVMYSRTLDPEWSSSANTLDALPMSEIFSSAAELANQLAALLENQPDNSAGYSSALSDISAAALAKTDALQQVQLSIQNQPMSNTVDENQSFSLYVQASGSGTLSYQWQKDGVDINGATHSTFQKESAKLSDTGIYRAVISSDTDFVTSLEAFINVEQRDEPLAIQQQPQNTTVSESDTIYLRVTASGEGTLSYQWQKGGSIIPGANDEQLSISNSTLDDAGSYRVTISNASSEIHSNFVNVWVTQEIAAPSISQQPDSITRSEGASAQFSVTASGGGFLSYQWRKNGTAIYGAYSSTFEIPELSSADAGYYDVVVSNSQGYTESSAATLAVLSSTVPVSITQQPFSIEAYEGQGIQLSVRSMGDGPLTYQWFFNDQEISGANSQDLSLSSVSSEQAGIYSVSVNNLDSSAHSQDALVTIKQTPSILLSWSQPSERQDGSLLSSSEISGYVIEYGYDPSSMNQRVDIEGVDTNEYTLSQVPLGTVYLRIATLGTDGLLSEFSSTISIDTQ